MPHSDHEKRRKYMNEYMYKRRHNNRKERDKYNERRRALHSKYDLPYEEIRYCERGRIEEIENYDLAKADNFVKWEIHHRNGLYCSRKELKSKKLYWNRPPEELIFLTWSEHASLHKRARDGSL